MSMRALPPQPHLVQIGELPLCCSWNGESRAHVYVPADVLQREEQAVPALSRFLCVDGVCSLPPALVWPEGTLIRVLE